MRQQASFFRTDHLADHLATDLWVLASLDLNERRHRILVEDLSELRLYRWLR